MPLDPRSYEQRRQRFAERIGPRAAALLVSAPEAVRSNDVHFPFRQDNDLLYLTGFPEPGSACLLRPGHPTEPFVLFVRRRDPEQETWTGRRFGVEGAVATFGANAAYPIEELESRISDLVADRDELYFSFGRDESLNGKVLDWLKQWQRQRPRTGKGPTSVLDPALLLHEMRLFKEPAELELMRRAATISAAAHRAAMLEARPGDHEFNVEAIVDYNFRRCGATAPAYPSIVAGGDNATILHYTANDQPLRDGDLLLIDAGAEFDGYCADITRTFPVGATFTPDQRSIYDLVLESQLEAIRTVQPGVPHDAPHERAVEVLVRGLCRLGLLHGEPEQLIKDGAYRKFYMHRTSHWLGMDVHDVGSYRVGEAPRSLEPGMVLTVEPGLYIAADCADVPAAFRGIGVRIEDDVLVTPTGHEVLTADAPKDGDEIEALRQDALSN